MEQIALYAVAFHWMLTVAFFFREVWLPWQYSSLLILPDSGFKVSCVRNVLFATHIVISVKYNIKHSASCLCAVDEQRKAKSTPAILAEIVKEEGLWVKLRPDLSLLILCVSFVSSYTVPVRSLDTPSYSCKWESVSKVIICTVCRSRDYVALSVNPELFEYCQLKHQSWSIYKVFDSGF